MPKDKYPIPFFRQMEIIVFIILQIFFATRTVLKIGQYHSDCPNRRGHIQSRDAFRPMRVSAKIDRLVIVIGPNGVQLGIIARVILIKGRTRGRF